MAVAVAVAVAVATVGPATGLALRARTTCVRAVALRVV